MGILNTIAQGLVVLLVAKSIQSAPTVQFMENNAPTVKIITPLTKSSYELNTLVNYHIKVSDPEDGESEYDEIPNNEVFLEVRYLPDRSKISKSLYSTIDPGGLTAIKKSNCFNCHSFNGKLIAPSLLDITKKYRYVRGAPELLAKRIREGSSGVWGSASMPSHEAVNRQQALDMVNWILKNAQDPNLNYYVGTEGAFRLNVPKEENPKGAFILRATYSDHGSQDSSLPFLSSKDVIEVYAK